MGVGEGLYNAVLVVHILTAILGFGAVMWNGFYALQARNRPPREGLAVSEANFAASVAASSVIYLVAVTGLLLVPVSDGAWRVGDFWIVTSLVTFVAAVGISHGMLAPNARRMLTLQRELIEMEGQQLGGPPEQAAELADRGKRQAAMGAVNGVLTVFMLYLMVFKPGL